MHLSRNLRIKSSLDLENHKFSPAYLHGTQGTPSVWGKWRRITFLCALCTAPTSLQQHRGLILYLECNKTPRPIAKPLRPQRTSRMTKASSGVNPVGLGLVSYPELTNVTYIVRGPVEAARRLAWEKWPPRSIVARSLRPCKRREYYKQHREALSIHPPSFSPVLLFSKCMHTFGPGCGEATARGNNSGLSERPRPGREEEREEPAAQYLQRAVGRAARARFVCLCMQEAARRSKQWCTLKIIKWCTLAGSTRSLHLWNLTARYLAAGSRQTRFNSWRICPQLETDLFSLNGGVNVEWHGWSRHDRCASHTGVMPHLDQCSVTNKAFQRSQTLFAPNINSH